MGNFERFIQERVYLKGISPATVRYYACVERAFLPILDAPTKAGMMECIQTLLNRGASPISVNTYLRGLKAYCLWLYAEGHLKEKLKVQFLKSEQKILATLSEEHLRHLIGFRPKGQNLTRAHLAALTIVDTGLRISEITGLKYESLDMEGLFFRVKGKGGKERLVPFSAELRKVLFKFSHRSVNNAANYIFGTRNRTRVTVRNIERDFKILGQRIGITGIRFSPHTLRHSFAVSYLRNGGNLEYLRRILGHSSISTTQKYLRSLGVEDLGAVHNALSPLSARR